MTAHDSRFVIDASVAVKLAIPEIHSDRAIALFRMKENEKGIIFFVPDFFYLECANVVWKYTRAHHYKDREDFVDLNDIMRLPLFSFPARTMAEPSLQIAKKFGVAVYDACYVALSEKMRATLVSADDKLLDKLEGSPVKTLRLKDFGG